jgi:hypothetical protein
MKEFKETKLEDLPLVEVKTVRGEWKKVRLLAYLPGAEFPYKVLTDEGYTDAYEECRPIKPKAMRPMTDAEIFNALKIKDCWLKDKRDEAQFSGWNSFNHKDSYQITYDGGKTWNALEVEE